MPCGVTRTASLVFAAQRVAPADAFQGDQSQAVRVRYRIPSPSLLMSSSSEAQLNSVIEKLVKDVELAVHAMYRGDVRQNTARARTDTHRRAAYEALRPLVSDGEASGGASAAPEATGGALTADEASAIMRCVMGWLPMGAPNAAAPDSRCVAAAREIFPTWGDRERARQAVKRVHG